MVRKVHWSGVEMFAMPPQKSNDVTVIHVTLEAEN